MVKVLVFFMMIQGIPLWELSRAYKWEFQPQKLQRVLDVAVSTLFSPGSAYAGVAPDPDDYTTNKIPGNFVDISDTGTQLSIADEGGVAGIPVGFSFEFFGTIFTSVTITANGYLGFSPVISHNNVSIPVPDPPNAFIAPFWDDLNPQLNQNSGIFYQTLGTTPNRQFIAEWKDVPLKSDPDSRLSFEVVLFEGSNEIQIHYLSMIDGSGLTTSPLVTGKSATIGIENSDGSKGNEVAFNKAGAVTSGSAFSFTLGGNAFETGRDLGDLNGDGQVNVQDQFVMTNYIIETAQTKPSLQLVLSDISPVPSPDGGSFGDQSIDSSDHSRIFEAVMGREELNPTLSLTSYYIASPSEEVALFGSGFDPVAGLNNTVVFAGVDGTETDVPAETVNVDGSELTVTIPSGLQFPCSIKIERASLMSNSLLFLLQGVPLITSLTPDSGEEGDTITIRGYEFGENPGDNIVTFNGIVALVDSVTDTSGIDTMIVTVPDGVSTGSLTVTVDSRPSNEMAFLYDGAPVVAIASPEEDGEVSGLVDVIGTASDLGLVSYAIEFAPMGEDFTTVVTGTESITDDVLGSIDTTLLSNGFYQLRVTAEDDSGKVSSITQGVLVSGRNKAGVFSMTFTDLKVPVKGVPITVKRTYDSRTRNRKMDFGYGWNLEVEVAGTYVNNRKPGLGWSITSSGGWFPMPCSNANELESHITEIRFSDTEFYRFAFIPGNVPALSSICEGYATYDQIGGVPGANLQIIGNNNWYYISGELVDSDTFNTFEPRNVRLTTRDGRQYDLDLYDGVTRIADSNGNSVSISDSGIVHSSGKSISFIRDAQGRLTRITDPMGNTLNYTYDANGDLVNFMDRVGNTTTFEYDPTFAHLLANIEDPLGNPAVQNEYDDNGRLIARIDADGNRTEMDIDVENNTTQITDREGQITILQYNDEGHITGTDDGSGNGLQFTYDDRGNKTSETDALSNTTTFTWDDNNNLLTETNALGNTIAYSWDANGRLSTVSDAKGNVTTNTCDANGNLLTITDPSGVVTNQFAYNSSGNVIRMTTLGGTWDFTYNTFGNVTTLEGPGNSEVTFTYNNNGNMLTRTAVRTTESGSVNETSTFTYDANGNVLTSTDPLGSVTTFTYNANGKALTKTDALGNVTSFEYDTLGNLFRITYPDGTNELFGYDRENRLTGQTDRAGRSILYEYNNHDKLARTIYPDGSDAVNTYDVAGRLVGVTDNLGNTFTYDYDAAKHLTKVTCPLGFETTFAYNEIGSRVSATNALGNITQFTYDESAWNLPRLTGVTFANGSSTSRTYNISGRIGSKTNESGSTTTFEYNRVGNLIKVTDALGNVTTYSYDEAGNRITETDANGNTTIFEYDANRNITKRILPLGMSETMLYDAVGKLISHTDFNGDVTTFAYDSMNRMILKALPGGKTITWTYIPTGKVDKITDSRGLTEYTYDVRDRVIRIDFPDGSFLAYTYDAAGNRTSVQTPSGTTTYEYNAVNLLATVTDPNGGITTHTYNGVGNLVTITYPNGTETHYTYDSRHRPVSVAHTRSDGNPVLAQYDYILDPAGNRTKMTDSFGRLVDYTHDALNRLTKEDDSSATIPVTYTYDTVGNRLTMGPVNFTYDNNNRMLSAGTYAFTYDDNGNLLTKVNGSDTTDYFYDAQNRLIKHTTPDGVSSLFTYDAFGNRLSKNFDGAVTNYLVDPHDNSGHSQVLEEKDGSGTLLASYVYGRDLIRGTNGSVDHYYHHDALGSTRMLTNASGAVSDTYNYDAFGNITGSTGTTPNNYLFTGEQFDPALDLYYLRARYMNPDIGRFITSDVFPGIISDPLTLHKYIYANNNPVNMTDPSGNFTLVGCMISIGIVGILSTIAYHAVYKPAKDIYDKVKMLLIEIPGLKINKDATTRQLRTITITRDPSGVINLGNGAVHKAYETVDGMLTDSGKWVSVIHKYNSATWMSYLPTVDGHDIPGEYLSCEFNDYVQKTYGLTLVTSCGAAKFLGTVANIIGTYLIYYTFLALIMSTANDLAYEIPPQPSGPNPTCN